MKLFTSLRLISFAIITLIMFLMVGCTNNVNMDKPTLKESIDKIQYGKDKYGNCYAMLSSIGYYSYITTSITTVPCNQTDLK